MRDLLTSTTVAAMADLPFFLIFLVILWSIGGPLVLVPIGALILLILCGATYFAVFLGYGTQLIAMLSFYIIASLWFHFWRYRFVRRGEQFTMPWPRPLGCDLRAAAAL